MAVLTISRGTFSGGLALAECIASSLDHELVSREVLAEAAELSGLPLTDLTEAIEKPPSFLERLSWDRHRYLCCVRAALCSHAVSGRLVYHGHGGHILLDGIPGVSRILVIADMERRLESAMRSQGLDREAAERHIERMDDYRRKWTRFLYGREWRDPFQFDMVLNLLRMSVDEACRLVLAMTEQPSFAFTEVSKIALLNAALASRAEAALLGDKRTRLRKMSVEADDGVVTVRAVARSRKDMDAVREVVGDVEGVKDIQLEMAMSLGLDSV
jgi:cytidylate kinase